MLVLKTVTFYLIYCLFIQGEVAEMQNLISSAYLKGKNMLMNVFNTNIYFICFISIRLIRVLKIRNKY
jgi:hypothetical protein